MAVSQLIHRHSCRLLDSNDTLITLYKIKHHKLWYALEKQSIFCDYQGCSPLKTASPADQSYAPLLNHTELGGMSSLARYMFDHRVPNLV